MSNTEKSKSIPFTTPRFKALWAHLDEPDTKFNPDGVYSTRAVIDPSEPEAASFLEFLDRAGELALEQAREEIQGGKLPPPKKKQALESLVLNPPYEPEYDSNGVETGNVVFNCKTHATRKDADGNEKPVKIAMCDARRNPIDASATKIGNGSVLRIKGTLRSNYISAQNKAYVTLYIGAVQLIDLVEYDGSGFDGFDDEETQGEADFKREEPGNGTFGGESNGDF